MIDELDVYSDDYEVTHAVAVATDPDDDTYAAEIDVWVTHYDDETGTHVVHAVVSHQAVEGDVFFGAADVRELVPTNGNTYIARVATAVADEVDVDVRVGRARRRHTASMVLS